MLLGWDYLELLHCCFESSDIVKWIRNNIFCAAGIEQFPWQWCGTQALLKCSDHLCCIDSLQNDRSMSVQLVGLGYIKPGDGNTLKYYLLLGGKQLYVIVCSQNVALNGAIMWTQTAFHGLL